MINKIYVGENTWRDRTARTATPAIIAVFLPNALSLFRMGFCGAAHNLSHTFYNDETWHSYTFPKEDQKTVEIT